MARHRTRRGGVTFGSLISRGKEALKGRLTKAGVFDTPAYQAAATASKDAKAAVTSPVGKAVATQASVLTTSQPTAAPVSVAAPAAPAPMARPVPTVAPVPASAASAKLPADEAQLVSYILWCNDAKAGDTQIATVSKQVADAAVDVKNKERNLAVLAALGSLATDVKALLDEGTPTTLDFEATKNPGIAKDFNLYEMVERIMDEAARARVAKAIASTQPDPKAPGDRKFLPGTINRIASGIRIALQKKLLLGGKTRRLRKGRRQTRRRV